MTAAYYATAGVLALVFLPAGLSNLFLPREKLVARGLKWPSLFSAAGLKLIGVAELAGAVGLLAPPLTGILPVLGPIAALGLVALQVGAAVINKRLNERPWPFNVGLAAFAAIVAVLGFATVA